MLSAEEIEIDLKKFYSIIEDNVTEPRKTQLLDLYKSQEEILVMAPASSRASFHNSFPGGYLNHVVRVVEAAIKVRDLWGHMEASINFSNEELVFAALNHDLGKLGMFGKPRYIPNDSEWHVKNQGANYKPNAELPFLPVQDNSLFCLQEAGIPVSVNEYIAIKTHDGLYDDGNKAYLISGQNESKLRSSLPLILHQADMMASRIEWEREHLDKVGGKATPSAAKAKTLTKPQASSEAMARMSAKNPGLLAALKNI